MRNIGRAAALITVLGMPALAYALASIAFQLWSGRDSVSLADASFVVEDGLAVFAAVAGASIACYLALTGYAMILGSLWRGGRGIPRALAALAPRGWTHVTATALGLSLSAGLAAPALAAEAGSTHGQSAGWVDAPVAAFIAPDVPAVSRPTVGWVAAGSPAAQPATAAQPAAAQPATAEPTETYVVRPGDSLWTIAQSLLGDASTSEVSAAWPAIYRANLEAIGGNPSLIHPGVSLTIPAGLGS